MLFYISFFVELGALLIAISLGIYLVTRNAHRPEAWLAALTNWSMGGLFLNMLLSLSPPPVPHWLGVLFVFWPKGILEQDPAAWLQGWSSTLSPMFWLHATLLIRSEPLKTWQRLALVAGYGLCLAAIAVQSLLPENYNNIIGDPLFLNVLQAGPVYGLALGMLVLFCSFSLFNLVMAGRNEPRYLPRRQLIILSAATILAGLTAPVGLVAAYLKIPVPMFLVALLIGSGVLVTGIGVARYSALMENRIFMKDLLHFARTNFFAVLAYLSITWGLSRLYPFPGFIYVLVGIAAVISHSLVDAARQGIDFTYFQNEKQMLRARLRRLDSLENTDLLKSLAHLLENVCQPIQASYAVLLVQRDGNAEQAAVYRWREPRVTLPAYLLLADEYKLLQPGQLPQPFLSAALLIPIYLGDQQVGALVLGAAEHGLGYSPVELGGLQEFSDYLGGWLSPVILQNSAPPELFRQIFPPALGSPGISLEIISSRDVELGLRSLYDYSRLAELPLAETGLVQKRNGKEASHIETGKAVHTVLCQALEWLRPPGNEKENSISGVPRRDWYPYIILRDAYVNCLPNREIMDRLYISEGTFNRTRRSAIRSLTRQLIEEEAKPQ